MAYAAAASSPPAASLTTKPDREWEMLHTRHGNHSTRSQMCFDLNREIGHLVIAIWRRSLFCQLVSAARPLDRLLRLAQNRFIFILLSTIYSAIISWLLRHAVTTPFSGGECDSNKHDTAQNVSARNDVFNYLENFQFNLRWEIHFHCGVESAIVALLLG